MENEQTLREVESNKQCLAVCAHASEEVRQLRTNTFENVSVGEGAHQVIVATLGDLISAQRVTAAVGAKQWLGQMSDTTLQQLLTSREVDLANA